MADVVTELAYVISLAMSEGAVEDAIAVTLATVIVTAAAEFALGRLSTVLASGQSEDVGPAPQFETVHGPSHRIAPIDVRGLSFSGGSLGGFQSRGSTDRWRVVGFAGHEAGAAYFDE